ncbi:hypothetical protein E9531_00110 [Lampropedia puyangensis]|uniref:DUF2782 domain-containing protein n=1 Tax=Lampropedia puyangensis TaxID=1330072 RepID=A0A4S8FGI5_9BURK|nr:hypothetical protein [Lampropedia puyangensis]THU05002.1 hypothetical protein E9531_00110 [Lampropedia puyangensis]
MTSILTSSKPLNVAFRLASRQVVMAVFLAAAVGSAAAEQTGGEAAAKAAPVVSERVVSGQATQSEKAASVQGAELLPKGQPEAERSPVRSYQQDAGSRIEELRVHGQTREITVTPAGTMPSYEVVPGSSRHNAISTGRSNDGTNGPRRWKVGEF